MNKNKYIQSVLPSSKAKKYPSSLFPNKKDLEKALKKKGLNIFLQEPLKGGFFSKVYSAELEEKSVVVKYIDTIIPFDPTEFFINRDQSKTDSQVLKLLQNSKNIKVPKIIKSFPEICCVLMEDLGENNFILLNDLILSRKLTLNSASEIGRSLAYLVKESRNFKQFKTNESAEQSIYERGLELRLAYPNSQKQYIFLENEFTKNNQYFCWPDNHPKNIFVKENGDCAFIDFGRSVWADQRYMLPNFLAHIVICTLIGYINFDLAKKYINNCIVSYKKIEPIDENIFCQYLAMEVLHRANGKWITGVETKEQKLSLYKFGLTVFDDKISYINKLLQLLS